jgi:hypothetical protein
MQNYVKWKSPWLVLFSRHTKILTYGNDKAIASFDAILWTGSFWVFGFFLQISLKYYF